MREFKIVETDGMFYFYPIPVIKEHKYLVEAKTLHQANELILKINSGEIPHPDQSQIHWVNIGFHKDGRTSILRYRADP